MLALGLALPLAGCSEPSSPGGSPLGSTDIEISDFDFGFVEAVQYDPDTFDMATAEKWQSLNVDTEYYVLITFEVTARRDNDGRSLFNVVFTFDSLNVMRGEVEDVNTGNVTSMEFSDAETGRDYKVSNLSFKVPGKSSEPQKMKIIVRLQPVKVGQSHIFIKYDYETADGNGAFGDDSNGYTKNIKIVPVKLATPVPEYDESLGILKWKHVKNADYYLVYEIGSQDPITDDNGQPVYIRADDGYSEGSYVPFNVGNYLSDTHILQVRAFSNSVGNIEPSDLSEPIQITIW